MTIGSFLDSSTKKLSAADIASARLDCLVLLEDTLQLDRAHIIAHPETKIPQSTEVDLNNKIVQRSTHKPLAYIRGHAQFYGRDFIVSAAVLVPRPETEDIISLALGIALPANPTIADVGTGSGCIGITLALALSGSNVYLYDISDEALGIARKNAKKYNVKTILGQQNLLESAPKALDLVVANLPYVPIDLPINSAAHFEPKLALFSGPDGLDLYRTFWQQLAEHHPRHVITESLPAQHAEIQKMTEKAGYKLAATQGFAQHFSLSEQRQA